MIQEECEQIIKNLYKKYISSQDEVEKKALKDEIDFLLESYGDLDRNKVINGLCTMERMQKAGCLGEDYNKYICSNCKIISILNKVHKGTYSLFNEDVLICPVCTSKLKKPTEKIKSEELEKRKEKLKVKSKK